MNFENRVAGPSYKWGSYERLLQLLRPFPVCRLCERHTSAAQNPADFPTVAQFALSSLKTLQTVLSSGDQYHLYSTATRALMTARRRGDPRAVEYWSGRPIVSISVAPYAIMLNILNLTDVP